MDHAAHQRCSAIQGESEARTARSARGQDGAGGGPAARGPPLSAAGAGPRSRSIGLRPQRHELHRKGAAYIEMFKGLGPDIAAEIADVELTDPDVTYDGQAEIDLGGHRAVLHSWGPAHSAGDQIILVDGRVLFGGDLFETRMFPIVPYFPAADTDVDGSRWITVLNQLIALDPAAVVPATARSPTSR